MPDETQQPSIEPTPEPISTPPVENPTPNQSSQSSDDTGQVSEPNPAPVSPDEPTVEAPVPTIESVPAPVPPGPTEAIPSPESAVLDKDQNPANEPFPVKDETSSSHGASEPAPVPEPKTEQNQAPETPQNPPETAPKPPTAHLPPIEPLENDQVKKRKENLERANTKRQEKKRDKINEILNLFSEKSEITNDEVEKLLHVSDATATRYLETLEKEGKIKQVGKTGKGVSYTKI